MYVSVLKGVNVWNNLEDELKIHREQQNNSEI